MSQVDWNNAPEWAGAAIESPCGREYFVEAWGGCSKRQLVGASKLDDLKADMSGEDHSWTLVETRPVAWNGEGKPPVGAVCDLRVGREAKDEGWMHAEIRYSSPTAVVWRWKGRVQEFGSEWVEVEVRPILTPEQIAEEERQREVSEIHCELVGMAMSEDDAPKGTNDDWYRVAEFMHAKGYRKQVAP